MRVMTRKEQARQILDGPSAEEPRLTVPGLRASIIRELRAKGEGLMEISLLTARVREYIVAGWGDSAYVLTRLLVRACRNKPGLNPERPICRRSSRESIRPCQCEAGMFCHVCGVPSWLR